MRILLAGEDEGHRIAVTTLTDRLVLERVDWARDVLDAARTWCDDDGHAFLNVKTAFKRASALKLPVYGHFDGRSADAEAGMWRAVFFLVQSKEGPVDLVVAARDADGDERRRAAGLKQAHEAGGWSFGVVEALAIEEIEAWFLAAYEPSGPREKERLEAVTRRLGLDPRRRGHRLTGGTERDPKRVIEELEIVLHDHGAAALQKAPWSTLRERGETIGLRAFLDAMNDALRDQFPEGRDEPW